MVVPTPGRRQRPCSRARRWKTSAERASDPQMDPASRGELDVDQRHAIVLGGLVGHRSPGIPIALVVESSAERNDHQADDASRWQHPSVEIEAIETILLPDTDRHQLRVRIAVSI